MLLRWGATTVLGHILQTLREAGIGDRMVVVGSDQAAVEEICEGEGGWAIFNPAYEAGEMLSSVQVGLRAMRPESAAALVVLGDQPSIQAAVIRAIVDAAIKDQSPLVVPSFQNRRGHPWLIRRTLWNEVLELRTPQTPRDFLRAHADSIRYVDWDSDSILRDIDSPQEYLHSRPQ
jgi:molybdenum cofactor cytidylyltransferase